MEPGRILGPPVNYPDMAWVRRIDGNRCEQIFGMLAELFSDWFSELEILLSVGWVDEGVHHDDCSSCA